MVCVVTRPIVDAAYAMLQVRFSRRDCTEWEGNITDKTTMIRDRPPMLKIVSYESANSGPEVSSV